MVGFATSTNFAQAQDRFALAEKYKGFVVECRTTGKAQPPSFLVFLQDSRKKFQSFDAYINSEVEKKRRALLKNGKSPAQIRAEISKLSRALNAQETRLKLACATDWNADNGGSGGTGAEATATPVVATETPVAATATSVAATPTAAVVTPTPLPTSTAAPTTTSIPDATPTPVSSPSATQTPNDNAFAAFLAGFEEEMTEGESAALSAVQDSTGSGRGAQEAASGGEDSVFTPEGTVTTDEQLPLEDRAAMLANMGNGQKGFPPVAELIQQDRCESMSKSEIEERLKDRETECREKLIKEIYPEENPKEKPKSCLNVAIDLDGAIVVSRIKSTGNLNVPRKNKRTYSYSREETRYSCANQGGGQPGQIKLSKASERTVTASGTVTFEVISGIYGGPNRIIKDGWEETKFTYKEFKKDNEQGDYTKEWRLERDYFPRYFAESPYKPDKTNPRPKSYWQDSWFFFDGSETGDYEVNDAKRNGLLKSFVGSGQISKNYATRGSLKQRSEPWLIYSKFTGRKREPDGELTEIVANVTGIDATACGWKEVGYPPTLGGFLIALHQTFLELPKLPVDLDLERRSGACNKCSKDKRDGDAGYCAL